MNPDRRSFFQSAFAWLGSLPLLSAWMLRPAQASHFGIDLAAPGTESTTHSYSLSAETFVPPGESFANWISVNERLPEVNEDDSRTSCSYSCRVLTASKDGTVDFSRLTNLTSNRWWKCGMPNYIEYCRNDVTHWAELPAAPDEREVAK